MRLFSFFKKAGKPDPSGKIEHNDNIITKKSEARETKELSDHERSHLHFMNALELSKSRDLDGVIRECDTALELDSQNAQAYKLRGSVFGILGDNPNMIADYSEYIKLNPGDSEIENSLSEIFGTPSPESQNALSNGIKELEAGKTNEALEIFNQAIERDPMNPELFRYRGVAQSVSGNLELSEKDFLKALDLSPYDEDIADDLDKVRQMINNEKIKKKIENGIPFDNSDHLGIINGEFSDEVKINSVHALGNSGDKNMVKELVMIMQEFGEGISDAAAESLRNLTQGNPDAAREAIRIQMEISRGTNWRDL